jgi:hypothetical protein
MRYVRQRGIYLTFGDASVINSDCKAILRHQMCPKRLPEEHKTNVPFVRRRDLWRVGPSTLANGVRARAAGKFCWAKCFSDRFGSFSLN